MRHRTLGLARPLAACAAAVLLLWPSPAGASTPEATDPSGDATPFISPCELVQPAPCVEPVGSLASVDIVEADLSTVGTDLVMSTTVLDWDAQPQLEPVIDRTFTMRTSTDDFDVYAVGSTGETTGSLIVYKKDRTGGGAAVVPVEIDAPANTFTFRAPLTALAQAAADACASCGSIGVGTVLDGLVAQTAVVLDASITSVGPSTDWAGGDAAYTVGDA